MRRFVSIDAETADQKRDSVCSLALVELEGSRRRVHHFLIRPPRRRVTLTWVHGITWADVANQPTFKERWPEIRSILERADVFAAHNAAFDLSVLQACTKTAGVSLPRRPVVCTVKLARAVWGLRPTDLDSVASFLGIPLDHHDARSDALACAAIIRAAGPQEVARLLRREQTMILARSPRGVRRPFSMFVRGDELPGGGRRHGDRRFWRFR